MRFCLVILSYFIVIALFIFCRGMAHVGADELFLVRILSIDREQNMMTIETVGKPGGEDDNKIFMYRSDNIPKELEKGDLIRIWGAVHGATEKNVVGNGKQNGGGTEVGNLKKKHKIKPLNIIKGKIAGASSGNMVDPTGVRRRLKRKMGLRPMRPRRGNHGRP